MSDKAKVIQFPFWAKTKAEEMFEAQMSLKIALDKMYDNFISKSDTSTAKEIGLIEQHNMARLRIYHNK